MSEIYSIYESSFKTLSKKIDSTLNVDEYTKEPVKTSYGYHIILKTGQEDKAELKARLSYY